MNKTAVKNLWIFLFLLGGLTSVSAQEFWFSGNVNSNSYYYVDDKTTGDFEDENRFRSNNYLRIDAGKGKFSAGLQLEGYTPQALLNFSPNLNKEIGVGTFYAQFKSDAVEFTLGHFYEQFGSGLVLRSYEERDLGLNNALRGIRVKFYPTNFFAITGLYANQRVGFDVSDGAVYGFDSEVDLSNVLKLHKSNLNVGLSVVNRSQSIDDAMDEFEPITTAVSGRLNFQTGGFYSNVEFVTKSKDALVEFDIIRSDINTDGKAFLFNTGYSKRGFGLDATIRRLENMSFYADREAEGNVFNEQNINYIPGLTKQHDYSLSNIYVYQAQPRLSFVPLGKSGEIGSQIDLFYNFRKGTAMGGKYGTKLALNYAAWYGLDAEYNAVDRTYDAEFLSFGDKYFEDLNMEVRKKWSTSWSSIFTLSKVFYSKRYIEETSGDVHATIVIADATHKFSAGKSIRIEGQHLWTKDDQKNWWGSTLEFNLSSKFSIYAADMYNYGNDLSKVHYYNFGGSFTKNSTRIALSYGRQRGGLLCVGGICRVVPESTGFGLTLSSSF